MNSINLQSMRNKQRGQTIIIAMVVLGVLLILGFVFLGLVASNSKSAYNLGNRAGCQRPREAAEFGTPTPTSSRATPKGADWKRHNRPSCR